MNKTFIYQWEGYTVESKKEVERLRKITQIYNLFSGSYERLLQNSCGLNHIKDKAQELKNIAQAKLLLKVIVNNSIELKCNFDIWTIHTNLLNYAYDSKNVECLGSALNVGCEACEYFEDCTAY